jgi:dimethylhistidine N-methyltransferase
MFSGSSITIQDCSPPPDDFRREVLEGLLAKRKSIPAKFLYDSKGSALFDRITQLDEYYLTRLERKILLRYRVEIAKRIGPEALLVEYGPGNGEKLEFILQSLPCPVACFPIDISYKPLMDTANLLAQNYPQLPVFPICADFYRRIDPQIFGGYRASRKTGLLLGSTIGNLEPENAVGFLRRIGETLGAGSGLVIGVDLIKDVVILENAYNDALGVTSQFNLNLLTRINRELNADFDLSRFRHQGVFNSLWRTKISRIEMHLQSQRAQLVPVSGFPVLFEEGETIHTENSYKYSISSFHELAGKAGFEPQDMWLDDFGFFSVHYLEFKGYYQRTP